MVAFRRLILALVAVTVLAGLASAQVGGGGATTSLVCNSVANVTPTLRKEGVTELIGDIVISCTGGRGVAVGQQIPTANIIITIPTATTVTSRLLGTATTGGTPSEALLLIDEPGSGIAPLAAGFGPAAPQTVCTTAGGCPEFSALVDATGAACTGTTCLAVAVNQGTLTPAPNIFQGLVSGNQVTFNGIPILPPVSGDVARVFRITNVRIDASTNSSQLVNAFVSVSPATALPLSNPNLTVASILPSLTTSVTTDKAAAPPTGTAVSATNLPSFTQCNPITTQNVAFLNFSEQFAAAFKTRFGIGPLGTFAGTGNSSFLGTSVGSGISQNVPGWLYNSESGLVVDIGSGTNLKVAGLADSGTRLQAQFANLPSGATIYVSKTNVTGFGTAATSTLAQMTTSAAGAFAAPSGTGNVTLGTDTLVPLTVTNGAATAVWEVTNTNPSSPETLSFAVYISFTPDLTNNKPTPGSAPTVSLSYAPLISQSTTWIPRFNMTPVASSLLNIAKCNTVLLFPYITSAAGFDTGIAISNTSADPLTPPTGQSTGSCTMSFFGANAPTGTIAPLGPIPPGNGSDPTKFAVMLSTVAPNFTGYMFAVCDFQFAHGFAFISDVGTRNLAMGYLALVVNNAGTLTRPAPLKAEGLSQ